jgi:hypothetical protein
MPTCLPSVRPVRSTQWKRLATRAVASAAVLLTTALHAQLIVPNQGETLPTFEVETVKPSSSDLGPSFHTHIWRNDNSYRTENTTLRDLIRDAFDAHSAAQLTGAPTLCSIPAGTSAQKLATTNTRN